MANRDALQLARDLREKFREQGEFSLVTYRSALADELHELANELYQDAVDAIAHRVDRESITPRKDAEQQRALFDLDGEYALGGGGRMAKALAQFHHAQASLMLDDQNLVSVQQANIKKRDELLRLQPYWAVPGVTKRQATEAWAEDNPNTPTFGAA